MANNETTTSATSSTSAATVGPDTTQSSEEEYLPQGDEGDTFSDTPGPEGQALLPALGQTTLRADGDGEARPHQRRGARHRLGHSHRHRPEGAGQGHGHRRYSGVIGSQLPAGADIDDIIAGARAEGRDDFAKYARRGRSRSRTGHRLQRPGPDHHHRPPHVPRGLDARCGAQGYILNASRHAGRLPAARRHRRTINKLPLRYFDTRQRGCM